MTATAPTLAPLLRIANVTKRSGGFTALDGVSVDIPEGQRFGLIGPNGLGKTTLINCISGVLRQGAGEILFLGTDISRLACFQRTRAGIARSFQISRLFKSMTVIENLLVALDFAAIGHGRGDAARRDGVMAILERMGLAAKADVSAALFSQVELRKMELARALAARPKLLISDEAMAGLSTAEVDEVLDLLLKLSGEGITIITIEHIMHAVMHLSERVVRLDAGRVVALGAPKDVLINPRVQQACLGVST